MHSVTVAAVTTEDGVLRTIPTPHLLLKKMYTAIYRLL